MKEQTKYVYCLLFYFVNLIFSCGVMGIYG